MYRLAKHLFYALPLRCILGFCWLLGSTATAAVNVELEGLPSNLKQNVLASLAWQDINAESLSQAYLQNRLNNSEQTVAAALQPFGYYQAKISSELIASQSDPGQWLVRYQVTLSQPALVDELTLVLDGPAAGDPTLADIRSGFPLQPQQPLVHAQYEQGKAAISSRLNRLGYLDATLAQAEVAVSRTLNTADIKLGWDSGQAYRFGQLNLSSPHIDSRLLERWAEFEPGERFDYAKLLSFQRKLDTSGFFEFSHIQVERDPSSGLADVIVDTAPAAKRLYKVSLGYGTDTGARTQLGFEQRWLNRYGHSLLADIRLAEREQSYSLAYRIPALRGRADSYSISWQQRDQQLPEYDSRSSRLSLVELSHTRHWQIQHSANVERDDFAIGSTRQSDTLWYLESNWNRFSSNQPVFPTRAQSLTLNGRLGTGLDQQQKYMARLRLQYLRVLPAPWDGRFLLRGAAGALNVHDFDRLAPQHRFYAGGDRSIRGFAYQSLSPSDTAGNKIGGRYLAELSVETDYRFAPSWAVATFIDAGQAFSSQKPDTAVGAGLGLRFITSLLLIRLDVANAISEPDKSWRLHLSLGTDF